MSSSLLSVFHPQALSPQDNKIKWGNLIGCSFALALAQLRTTQSTPFVVVTQDIHTAEQLKLDLQFFLESKYSIQVFPDWETLPFDHFSPHEDIISNRLKTLSQLPQLCNHIVIASIHSLMHRLAPPSHIQGDGFALALGDQLSVSSFCNRLIAAGYHRVEKVLVHGEFAHRGSIIDYFPMGYKEPIRIELFDNEIAELRLFDPETQRTIAKIDHIDTLLPAHEFPLTEDAITLFRKNFRARFSGNPSDSPLYQAISQGRPAAGCQYYLPLFFEQLAHFFDYLPPDTTLFMQSSAKDTCHQFMDDIKHRHDQLSHDISRPLCMPQELFLSIDEFFQQANQFAQIQWQPDLLPTKQGHYNYAVSPLPAMVMDHKKKLPLQPLKSLIDQDHTRALIAAQSQGRSSHIQELLQANDIHPNMIDNWPAYLQTNNTCSITQCHIETGCILTDQHLALISENDLFGQHPIVRSTNKESIDPSLIIRNLLELKIGSPVVHINLGVGRYLGLAVIETDHIAAEYLSLEYANQDKVYIPIHDLHLILRYTGADADHAPLQKLGSKQWDKAKQAAQKRATDVAAELLEIYSQRKMKKGFSFSSSDINYPIFCQQFEFMETEDQTKAIHAVIEDMTSDTPMDRLICGDVGFGKTEVAMRAAFIAAQNNKQSIILVPTTLLATQHYNTFTERFAQWPIQIVILSRMQSTEETNKALAAIKNGTADIVIGTHKLLNDAIIYKDLGLLIIDEEHRFGVKQKEKIKAFRTNIDILTLTATPIPRTLNLALSGSRDISIIASPPDKRLSVKTFVHDYQQSIIKEALLREFMRGGQVIFLHNDIATIQNKAQEIQELMPQASIAVAHAQLPKDQLANIMTGFYHQQFNILISTTIVESGIDIPTANTIIINQANRFGLAELHQLRGRVGRSHHQAYAYLLVNRFKSLNKDAQKRLDIISQLSQLGAGFILSTHDLEIRGAGALLGEQQSGHIQAVGFSLYLEMIEQAVNNIKTGSQTNRPFTTKTTTQIDLKVSALFPSNYIEDVNMRLEAYKQLAECKTSDQISTFKITIIDRFGKLPPEAIHLFDVTLLKLYAASHDISNITLGQKYGYIKFNADPNINFATIIDLIQTKPLHYALKDGHTLRFNIADNDTSIILKHIYDIIKLLSQ